MKSSAADTELSSVTPEQWEEARRVLPVVRELAENPQRTRAQVVAAASALGCGPTHLYALVRRYSADRRLTSLLPQRPGPDRGYSRLSAEVEALVDEAIETLYLTRQRPRMTDLVIEVRRRCRTLGLTAPGRKAITARVRGKPRREVVARRDGRKAARDRFAPAIGSLEAGWPLSLVQIDHTLVDVIVVDSVTRHRSNDRGSRSRSTFTRVASRDFICRSNRPRRPVLLCASRMPCYQAALAGATKDRGEWPIQGLMTRLHLDNAKEFHSEALRRGCEQYGIAIEYRPVRTPHYGGHIERLIGTMMGKVHLLPGTTFSNVQAKGDLDPEKYAAMTLDELERWLAHAITGVYHRDKHRALDMPPMAAWERGIVGQ